MKNDQQQPTPNLKPTRRTPSMSRAEIEEKLHAWEIREWAKKGVHASNWDDLLKKLKQMEHGKRG